MCLKEHYRQNSRQFRDMQYKAGDKWELGVQRYLGDAHEEGTFLAFPEYTLHTLPIKILIPLSSVSDIQNNSASWKIALIFDNDDDDLMIKMHWYMTKICGNLCHISKRRELVPYFGKSLAQVVIRGSHRSWVAYESWHDKCHKIYFWEHSFIYKKLIFWSEFWVGCWENV